MMIQRLPCRTDHQPKVAISDRICRLRHRSRWTATSGCRDSLLPTPESDVVYWDAGCPGFGVKITPKGRKVFIVLYRIGGADSKLRKYTIGPYGRVTLHQARVATQRVFAAKLEGRDPAAEKRAAKRRVVADRVGDLLEMLLPNGCRRTAPVAKSRGFYAGKSVWPGSAGAFMRLASETWLNWSRLLNSAGPLPPRTRP